MSEFTVRKVIKVKLKAKSLARTQKFFLTDRLKALRLLRSKKILSILKKKMPVILFSDEKYFTVNQVFNSGTDRYISSKSSKDVPHAIKSIHKSKHPAQVMVFGLVASNGMKMPPVFLKTRFRMGAKEYLDWILVNQVLPWVQSNFPNNNGYYVFMQDGAPCHTAKSVQNWLGDLSPSLPLSLSPSLPKFLVERDWPPSSPDLNPLDFFFNLGVCASKGLCSSALQH